MITVTQAKEVQAATICLLFLRQLHHCPNVFTNRIFVIIVIIVIIMEIIVIMLITTVYHHPSTLLYHISLLLG